MALLLVLVVVCVVVMVMLKRHRSPKLRQQADTYGISYHNAMHDPGTYARSTAIKIATLCIWFSETHKYSTTVSTHSEVGHHTRLPSDYEVTILELVPT